jgi:hypothetical protein
MDSQPYLPGGAPADSAPLARFLPALEAGGVSAWLARQNMTSNWTLDPFGFSPQFVLEAARSGYRVLVAANNPVARFLLETSANPPAPAEFTAALADLGASRKGDERLEAHFQSLYLTPCEKCKRPIQAQYFLWNKDEVAPYARVYACPHCGDVGERLATDEDIDRAKKIAAADALHRARAYEKVVARNDEERVYAEEAVQHYLPRPLYILTTIVNRLDHLNLSAERKRALTALLLVAFDAGNTLWAHPVERPRPKQLVTPHQFRENNLWLEMERGIKVWAQVGAPVPCEMWRNKIPASGGVLIYEGRLKDLAREVKKEIPIAAVIGAAPRPNQAFWTLSALWAGWLWGKDAVEPYKVALRRRRYDWAWNATALHAAFNHLNELLPEGVPFFCLLPEPEPAFLTSVFTAANASGFSLQSVALRTEHDPVQSVWKRAQKREAQNADAQMLQKAIAEHLAERGEPARYLHVHAAGLIALAEANALKQPDDEFDSSLRKIHALFESALKDSAPFIHYSSSEHIETGLWFLAPSNNLPITQLPITDSVEIAIVAFLQKNKSGAYREIEADLYPQFTGLLAPSQGLIYAVLNSYAEKDGDVWKLRAEDFAAARRGELNDMFALIELIGKKLGYKTRKENKFLHWEENGKTARSFYILASALISRALENATAETIIVIPGGRAALIAYKRERDPALKARLKNYRVVKYRLLRAVAEIQVLTRESFEEQLVSDPVEQSAGQMLMF